MSNTWTMFACCSDKDRRASSRNIATNFLFLVSAGRMRLRAMFFLKPCRDSATPRKTSAIPPAATRSVMRYRLSGMEVCRRLDERNLHQTQRSSNSSNRPVFTGRRPGHLREGLLFDARGGLLTVTAADVGVTDGATAGLRHGGLLALRLLLAVDAQRGHRPRHQPPKRDRLAAFFADVDLVGLEAQELFGDLAEQELLTVVQ